MPRPLTLVLLLTGLIYFSGISDAQQIYLSTQDPINERIIELQARGYLARLSRTERPWLVADIISSILDSELSLDPVSKVVAEEILAYFQPMRRTDSELVGSGGAAGLGIRALSRERREGYFNLDNKLINRDFRNELGSVYMGQFWVSRQSRWGIDTRLIFDSDGTRYPWYYVTAPNGRPTGQYD